MEQNICIIGAGGFAKEVNWLACEIGIGNEISAFLESDDIWKARNIHDIAVKPLSYFNVKLHKAIIAVADSRARKKIVLQLPSDTEFQTLIHPNVVMSDNVRIGAGSIICAGSILTCDITIGKHAHLNLTSTIGHDCVIGDYFTTGPAVNISGNCTIGECVNVGTNSAVREKIKIVDNVIIGMGGIVVKNISQPGIYVGNPAKILHYNE